MCLDGRHSRSLFVAHVAFPAMLVSSYCQWRGRALDLPRSTSLTATDQLLLVARTVVEA
jgi:hypothetical protein